MSFQFFGVPIVLESGVLLLGGLYFLLGMQRGEGLAENIATILVLFTSILWHELGHATAMQQFGTGPRAVVIRGLGGATIPERAGSVPQELAIALAGPAFGLVLGFLALAGALLAPLHGLAAIVVSTLASVNLFWSLFNLLPFFPMDGGLALARVLQLVAPAFVRPVVFGLGVLGGVAILAFATWLSTMGSFGALFMFLIGGSIAWQNGQRLLGRA